MKHRIAIVGTGDIAYYHAQAMRSLPEVELTAACDISPTALAAFAGEFSVPRCYRNLQELLDNETVDIAIICTWGTLHKDQSVAIVRSGKARAILCEKPISSTAKECQEMARVANENDVLLLEAFKFRYHPQHLKVKDLLESGRIGDVCSIHATFSSPMIGSTPTDNWRFNRARGAGSIYDTAGYCINLCRYLAGRAPERVFAVGQFGPATGADESTAILLDYPGGITAQISTSYRYCFSQLVTVYCSKGMIRMEMAFNIRRPMTWCSPSLPVSIQVSYEDLTTETIGFPAVNQFGEQLKHLCLCLDGQARPRISLQESMENMATIDAIYASMRSGTPAKPVRQTMSAKNSGIT